MRAIPTIGVITLFTPLAWKYNNFRAKLITINGLLCHMNESHPKFKYNDRLEKAGSRQYLVIFAISPLLLVCHGLSI